MHRVEAPRNSKHHGNDENFWPETGELWTYGGWKIQPRAREVAGLELAHDRFETRATLYCQ